MTDKDYLNQKNSNMEKALKKSSRASNFNKMDDTSAKSFIHILVGIHEYIFAYFHIDLKIDDAFFEYTIPYITDVTFSEISGNKVIADNEIDGIFFIDPDGFLVSGDDSQEISKIVTYQSKSSSSSNKSDKEISNLLNSLQEIINDIKNLDKKSSLVPNNILDKVHDILLSRGINEVELVPLFISLNHNPKISDFNISPTKIESFNNNNNYNLELNKIILSSSTLSQLNIEQTPTSTLHLAEISSHPYPNSKIHPYIGFVYIFDYLDFLNQHKNKSVSQEFLLDEGLFLKNVRANVGDTQVNKAIKSTFSEGPNSFSGDMWWLSNGITIVAKDIELSGENVTLTEPSIVNGQQTSRQLANAFLNDKDKFLDNNPSYSPWKLMVKIFVGNYEDENIDELLNKIISGLNSQSSINKNSIDLIYKETTSFKEALSKKNIQLEIRNGEFSRNEAYVKKNKKENILYIDEFIQYAASALFIKETNYPISIGKIRSSKNIIVRDFHKKLFIMNGIDQQDLILLARTIPQFKKNLMMTEDEIKMGMQYLSFAIFRLIFRKFQYENGTNEKEGLLINNEIFNYFKPDGIKSIKDKLAEMIKKYPNINWDQESKTADFQKKLDEIVF